LTDVTPVGAIQLPDPEVKVSTVSAALAGAAGRAASSSIAIIKTAAVLYKNVLGPDFTFIFISSICQNGWRDHSLPAETISKKFYYLPFHHLCRCRFSATAVSHLADGLLIYPIDCGSLLSYVPIFDVYSSLKRDKVIIQDVYDYKSDNNSSKKGTSKSVFKSI
jgi:hypothetical protein